MDREFAEEQFGSRVHGPVEDGAEQWEYGANRLTDMACKASDDLEWEQTDDGQVVVRNTKYGEEQTADELWRALWVLERDVRVNHGDPFFGEREQASPSLWTRFRSWLR